MPRMSAIALLLFLVSYVFAVMFTQLFADLYAQGHTDQNYFGRLDASFFSLFQIMTLDQWSPLAYQVMAVSPGAWLGFVVFVIITSFIIVNMIIAVICDAISVLHDDDKAKLHGTYDGDDSSDNADDKSNDRNPGLQKQDVAKQLEQLEGHVHELSRMQQETLTTLHTLARHIQEKRRLKRTCNCIRGKLGQSKKASLVEA
jgi:hypothetical protein